MTSRKVGQVPFSCLPGGTGGGRCPDPGEDGRAPPPGASAPGSPVCATASHAEASSIRPFSSSRWGMKSRNVQHGTGNAARSWGSNHTPLRRPCLRAADNLRSSHRLRASWRFQVAGRKVLGRQSPPFPSHLWTGALSSPESRRPRQALPANLGSPSVCVPGHEQEPAPLHVRGVLRRSLQNPARPSSSDQYRSSPPLPAARCRPGAV